MRFLFKFVTYKIGPLSNVNDFHVSLSVHFSFCVGAPGKCFARIKMCCCEMLIELTVSTGVDVNIIPL